MKIVVIASKNPVKLSAVQNGFERMYPRQNFQFDSLSVPSDVADQPFTDGETRQGAENRARMAARMVPEADYWVGVEGGIDKSGDNMAAFAWIVVLSQNGVGRGRTGAFYLPPRIAELVRSGKELGEADDIVFGRTNSKQASGAVGLLTGDVIDRSQLYEQAVILALIPFMNPDLYDMG